MTAWSVIQGTLLSFIQSGTFLKKAILDGAGDAIRTRDILLGKEMLYH